MLLSTQWNIPTMNQTNKTPLLIFSSHLTLHFVPLFAVFYLRKPPIKKTGKKTNRWFLNITVIGQHFQRFCVYNGFAIARDGEHGLQPEDIDPFMCTHIIFSFAEIDESGTRLKDPDHFEANYLYVSTVYVAILSTLCCRMLLKWNVSLCRNRLILRLQYIKLKQLHLPMYKNLIHIVLSRYQRIIRLRKLNHRLNMILSVGGWDKGGEGFSRLVSSRENMLKFTKWVIIYLRRFDFDGLDFDWQFPALRESNLQDKKRFADLCDVSIHQENISWWIEIKLWTCHL